MDCLNWGPKLRASKIENRNPSLYTINSMASGDDAFTTLFIEVGTWTDVRFDVDGPIHAQRIMDLYFEIAIQHLDHEPGARAIVTPLIQHTLNDAAEIRRSIQLDPASPGLETRYGRTIHELSTLATIYTSLNATTHCVPDPEDEYTNEYLLICAEIKAMSAAFRGVCHIWEFVRAGYIMARRGPPACQAKRKPLADDHEYYL